ncbi:MAG: DUF2130 domain-containing protein [Bacteroidia bacterium]|nr:DUF2130 domain-containing protein [Bacteroidia bacterium]
MSTESTQITCPNCGTEIAINEILAHQTEERLRREMEQKMAGQRHLLQEEKKNLEADRLAFEEKKKKENELFQERLSAAREAERKKLDEEMQLKLEEQKKELARQLEEKQGAQLKMLQEDLEKKQLESRQMKQRELELLEQQRLLKTQTEDLEMTLKKQFLEKEELVRQEAARKEQERNELKFKEYEKKFEDQKKLIEELQRKSQQGSMQLQGEVQELAIEQWLRENFPLDVIEEIKKGVRGADCVQLINTHNRPNIGAIYYESKRTKDFQPAWIEKFKADMREKGAQFGVLVTDVLPKDMQRLGQREGIWICTYEEFKGLCFVLRESVILLQHAAAVQENKGEKMSMLYDFLTGNEFRMQVEAIVEGFTQMQEDLNSERRAMETIWKKREKQIQKVLFNTNQMYGSVKGIAGNAIGSIKALELPGADEE